MTGDAQAGTDDGETLSGRQGRAWGRLLLALLLLLLLVLAATWLQRRTIAREYVDRELARRGVPASYEIEQLSPWRQRLTNLVIGDPQRPDLTADWVELRTAVSPWRADILVVRAGKVRARGTLRDGRLSLGAIDRLLPQPSGAPFALPQLSVDVAEAQLQLATDHGPVDLALSGQGLLSDGFRGNLRAAAPSLRLAGCTATGARAALRVQVRAQDIALDGPLAAARLACGATVADRPQLRLAGTLGHALDRWNGTADLSAGRLSQGKDALAQLAGSLTFSGNRSRTQGKADLRTGRFAAASATGDALGFRGSYDVAGSTIALDGQFTAQALRAPAALVRQVGTYPSILAGTPLAPLATRAADALMRAAQSIDAQAQVALASRPEGLGIVIPSMRMDSRSGARLRFDRADGTGIVWQGGAPLFDGAITLGGGGMPEAEIRFARSDSGTVRGAGRVRPYRSGASSLAMDQLAFTLDGSKGRLSTTATLSGPLGDGRVEDLVLPIEAAWDPQGWRLNPRCTQVRFASLALGGASFSQGVLPLCPQGPSLVQGGRGGLRGGATLAATRLAGTMDGSPLVIAFGRGGMDVRQQRFSLEDLSLSLGSDRISTLAATELRGSFAGQPAGTYAGLSGGIGGVPIRLSEGSGNWRLAAGALTLDGRMQLSDTAEPVRFHPVEADQAAIRVQGDEVTATARLQSPKSPAPIGEVRIAHHLGDGAGTAVIDVPGLRFAEGGFQPSDLTPLTFGVVADVSGRVVGQGRIAWNAAGVTSSGTFATESLDLAAAFGPVRGLATEIHFTDLLGMRTAPAQAAAVDEVNPGVAVANGAITYRILDSRRVQVEGARWPFAGGELVLDPTLLDFSEAKERRLTFHVRGADAALFLKGMGFGNLDATGLFDGTLPMIFDSAGGRIEGGFLRARGGGSLAYVGEVSQQDLGFWGNMAFEALKALDYRSLQIGMNGPLAGEMITDIRFTGVSQGQGTQSNFLIRRLAKLPFVFNVRIAAPFYQLLDSVRSWYDPQRLIERNLPTLLEDEARQRGVQPGDSSRVRQEEVK